MPKSWGTTTFEFEEPRRHRTSLIHQSLCCWGELTMWGVVLHGTPCPSSSARVALRPDDWIGAELQRAERSGAPKLTDGTLDAGGGAAERRYEERAADTTPGGR